MVRLLLSVIHSNIDTRLVEKSLSLKLGESDLTSSDPSSDTVSPVLSAPSSFRCDATCDSAQVPVSSSPPTSSPGMVATPPQDMPAQVYSLEQDVDVTLVAGVTSSHICKSSRCDGDSTSEETEPSSRAACTGVKTSPKHLLEDPDKHSAESYSEDSSSNESWIEDYIEEGSFTPDVLVDQQEFTRQLVVRLNRVLEERARIQALSPTEDISPYSRDLRARAAGLTFTSVYESDSKTTTQTHTSPPSGGETSTTLTLPGMLCTSAPAQDLYSETDETAGNSETEDTDKENLPSSPAAGRTSLLYAFSDNLDSLSPRTPDLDKSPPTPSAPKKTLRHMHLPGPREEPPRLVLPPSQNPTAVQPQETRANDVFGVKSKSSASNSVQEDAYSQTSSTKRPGSEEIDNTNPKKRKTAVHRSRPKDIHGNVPNSRNIHSTLLDSGKFATRRASLRKAASLRSESSLQEKSPSKVCDILTRSIILNSFSLKDGETSPGSDLEPVLNLLRLSPVKESHIIRHENTIEPSLVYPITQPATPMHLSARAQLQARLKDPSSSLDGSLYPLPILAPPPYVDIPRAPVNGEELAETRIAIMILKEEEERKSDGLLHFRGVEDSTIVASAVEDGDSPCEKDELDESVDEDEENEVLRAVDNQEASGKSGKSCRIDEMEVDCNTEEIDVFGWSLQRQICIDEEFRQEAVEWILDVSRPSSLFILAHRLNILRFYRQSFAQSRRSPDIFANS